MLGARCVAPFIGQGPANSLSQPRSQLGLRRSYRSANFYLTCSGVLFIGPADLGFLTFNLILRYQPPARSGFFSLPSRKRSYFGACCSRDSFGGMGHSGEYSSWGLHSLVRTLAQIFLLDIPTDLTVGW